MSRTFSKFKHTTASNVCIMIEIGKDQMVDFTKLLGSGVRFAKTELVMIE